MMVLAVLRRYLAGVWGYVAAALGGLGVLLYALARAKKAGKDEVIAATAEKEVENAHKANQIDSDVASAKPDDVRERLRKFERD